jgi:hypothetical protein
VNDGYAVFFFFVFEIVEVDGIDEYGRRGLGDSWRFFDRVWYTIGVRGTCRGAHVESTQTAVMWNAPT